MTFTIYHNSHKLGTLHRGAKVWHYALDGDVYGWRIVKDEDNIYQEILQYAKSIKAVV